MTETSPPSSDGTAPTRIGFRRHRAWAKETARILGWRYARRWPTLKSRTDVLNFLAIVNGYRRYLEIGVRDPRSNFDLVRIRDKTSVDPEPEGHVDFEITSDEFFTSTSDDRVTFDLIFIDGLHIDEHVERDIENALQHLTDRGTVVVHDCNPLTEQAQSLTYDGARVWNGTVWKAWVKLRATRSDLAMQVVDIDHGCGVITRGTQCCYPLEFSSYDELEYGLLEQDRRALLNLIPVRTFMRDYVPSVRA